MEKTKIKEKDLRKIICENIEKEEPKTYYVANSSYFGSTYEINDIATAVQKAGGKNVHIEPGLGWSDLPEVVGFEATEEEKVNEIAAEVARMLNTE